MPTFNTMLTVSNYHYIRDDFSADYPSIFGVTPYEFENQLLLLQQTGIFIHPDELINNSDAILHSDKNYLLVTFDDGLKEQYDMALPILDKLGIPAVFFVNSLNYLEQKVSLVHKIHLVRSVVHSEELYAGLVAFSHKDLSEAETKNAIKFYRFDDEKSAKLKYFLNVLLDLNTQEKFINSIFVKQFDEKEICRKLYMKEGQLRSLLQRNLIGSHTHSHIPLGVYTEKVMSGEILAAKKFLEDFGGHDIKLIAYPYGTTEAATIALGNAAREAGHEYGFTTVPGPNGPGANKLLLNRYDCNDLPGGRNYKPEPANSIINF